VNYSVELYSTPAFMHDEGPIPPAVEVGVEYIKYYSTTKSHCGAQDVYALGIDRGNDRTGTEYEADMLQKPMADGRDDTGPEDDPARMTTSDDWNHRTVNWLRFPKPEDFTEPLRIHRGGVEDELIIASRDCVEMPDPGWHLAFTYVNGTIVQFHDDRESVTIDGEEHREGDHFELWQSAAWYPVCECEKSRHVAMRLDPPPGKLMRGSEGGIIHPNGTIEAPSAEVNESGWLLYPDTEVPRRTSPGRASTSTTASWSCAGRSTTVPATWRPTGPSSPLAASASNPRRTSRANRRRRRRRHRPRRPSRRPRRRPKPARRTARRTPPPLRRIATTGTEPTPTPIPTEGPAPTRRTEATRSPQKRTTPGLRT
jgi:hypothetical protein